ncbi:VirB4 family type IV secretion system protein [Pyrolobus fumarii]|uniref:VirB4 family type IV secretion system protein n=1 Tax=Pyrolobus fumarii TaxID=54252 RepID=UPI00064FE036|nr:DUF87 domain-containing protein [Pyrolobus fumarii]
MLPEEEQEAIIDSFRVLLDKLEKTTQLIVRRVVVKIEGEEVPGYEFYIASEQRLDPLLSRAGLRYEPLLEPPPPLIDPGRCELRRSYAVCGGRVYRVVTVYGLPRVLAEGFLYNLYPHLEEARLCVTPLSRHAAFRLLRSRRKLLEMLVASWQIEGKAPRLEKLEELQLVSELMEEVAAREARLHAVRVALVVSGSTPSEAREAARLLIRELDALGFAAGDSTIYYYKVYECEEPKPIFTDSVTLAAFYPFITTQLVEPGGIYLGRSLLDDTPVVLDLWARTSYNVVVLGMMGYGKSAFAKKITLGYSRLDPELRVYIIDRTGEYIRVGKAMNADIFELKRGVKAGLDPFRLMHPEHAATFIAALLSLEPDLKAELQRLASRCTSLEEVANKASERLRERLLALLEGPLGFLFTGQEPKPGKRVVIVLREMGSPEAERLAAALSLLVILKRVREEPRSVRKIVVLDEFVQVLEAFRDYDVVSALLQAFRDSRKLYTSFVHIAHDPRDVSASRAARVIAVQLSSLKVLFHHDYDAAQAAAELFGLTDQEKELIMSADVGDALILTEGLRLPVHVVLKEEEQELFETRPWATAGSGFSKLESGHGGG